jgi:galactosamine-6-phosphate isomerase
VNILYCEDYESVSVQAGSLVIAEIKKKKNLLLCAATGNSPIGLYNELVKKSETDRALFEELRIIKLDEWGGIPGNDPGSSERYLRTRLLEPMGIAPERYISFASTPSEPAEECKRIRSELEQHGAIDVCILGLGINGHIGFNEPGPFLIPHCHVARLSDESRRHAMVRSMDGTPHFGLTLGMREILAARRIILLVAGEGKNQAIAGLLSGEVSTTLPASLLWLHQNVDCLIDQNVFANHEQRPPGRATR